MHGTLNFQIKFDVLPQNIVPRNQRRIHICGGEDDRTRSIRIGGDAEIFADTLKNFCAGWQRCAQWPHLACRQGSRPLCCKDKVKRAEASGHRSCLHLRKKRQCNGICRFLDRNCSRPNQSLVPSQSREAYTQRRRRRQGKECRNHRAVRHGLAEKRDSIGARGPGKDGLPKPKIRGRVHEGSPEVRLPIFVLRIGQDSLKIDA